VNATPSDWITLRSESLVAQIDPQGAQLSVLRDSHQRELLWNGDPAEWKSRAPILFPIVGTLNGGQYRWQGASYPLPRHGFARERRFAVVRHDEHEALFRLVADAETRRVFPFDFELDVAFTLAGSRLSVQASVHNRGTTAFPASLGFHPGFMWPLREGYSRDAHYLEFETEEPAPVRRLNAAGLLTNELQPTPVVGRRLNLADALFAEDVVIFDRLASRSLVYVAADGPRIAVDFPDATHLGLWTKPAARFICIEPWRGVADPFDFKGEFGEKPGAFQVTPGGWASLTMHITTTED
jgi:galactose mutarotase-like enzyme